MKNNNKEHFKWGKGIPFGQDYIFEPVGRLSAQEYINIMDKESNEFDLTEISGIQLKNKYNQTCGQGCGCSPGGTYLNLSPMIFPRGTSYYYYPY